MIYGMFWGKANTCLLINIIVFERVYFAYISVFLNKQYSIVKKSNRVINALFLTWFAVIIEVIIGLFKIKNSKMF